jgi:hypothetical protein
MCGRVVEEGKVQVGLYAKVLIVGPPEFEANRIRLMYHQLSTVDHWTLGLNYLLDMVPYKSHAPPKTGQTIGANMVDTDDFWIKSHYLYLVMPGDPAGMIIQFSGQAAPYKIHILAPSYFGTYFSRVLLTIFRPYCLVSSRHRIKIFESLLYGPWKQPTSVPRGHQSSLSDLRSTPLKIIVVK